MFPYFQQNAVGDGRFRPQCRHPGELDQRTLSDVRLAPPGELDEKYVSSLIRSVMCNNEVIHTTGEVHNIIWSTPTSRPNKTGLKCPSVCPSVHKSFFDFNDGMRYDPIQGQGQDHEPLKVGNSAIFEGYLLPLFTTEAGN